MIKLSDTRSAFSDYKKRSIRHGAEISGNFEKPLLKDSKLRNSLK